MGRVCSTNVEKRNAYRLLVGKPEGKTPLGRPRRSVTVHVLPLLLVVLLMMNTYNWLSTVVVIKSIALETLSGSNQALLKQAKIILKVNTHIHLFL
jgi:hypothetical protein